MHYHVCHTSSLVLPTFSVTELVRFRKKSMIRFVKSPLVSQLLIFFCKKTEVFVVKLRMDMGNVPKRQQPDRRARNIQFERSPMGLQKKIQNSRINHDLVKNLTKCVFSF